MVTLSQADEYTYPQVTLANRKTNVYPIKVKKKTDYNVGFTNWVIGDASIQIINSSGKVVYDKDISLCVKAWKTTLSLSKGTYYIKILSKTSRGFLYELSVKPAVAIKDDTIKMTSCDNRILNPGLGKGKWSTSNKNIVTISSKNANNIASCKIWAKKTGTATVTYTNSSGSRIKYKITVKAGDKYPIDEAYFTMDSVGGLEPHILISNNSDKTIKYVDLRVSFYNAVGDKVTNDIGAYRYANIQVVGPIKPWKYEWYEWKPVFYNVTAYKMKIETATVTYMDGSKKSITVNKKYSSQ
jgi:hypothetical protein